MARDGEDESVSDEEAALAETRLVLEEQETVLATGEAETVLETGEAETVLAEEPVGAPDSDTDDLEEDDRTQLVDRGDVPIPSDANGAAASEKDTRVLDPSVGVAASAAAAAGGTRRLPDTRVLDEPDKTAPPAARASAPGARPNRPNPTPIDSDRGLAPGTVLFGEYEIVNVLGVGGMGEVYRAKHRRLEEHRAIKVMHAELSKKKGASEFFYREAKALLAVRHPAVVHCHDLLSDDEGRVYLIMEMIEGIPLSKKMNDGPLSPDDVAVLGARVSHGLAAAHRKGVIHRDVSPDNIVLPNGRVQEAKIIDFGIAKLLEEGEGTIVDGFKGKLSYASPEQLGFFGGKIDGRSDFYSLGLVLVAAALGRPMGMGTSVVEAVDARRSFETLPDAIPVGLRSAIQPLLALDPDDRPKYVDRLFVVPGGVEGADSGPISTGGIRSAPKSQDSNKRAGLFAGLGALAAALVGGGLFMTLGGGGESGGADATSPTISQPKPDLKTPAIAVAPGGAEPVVKDVPVEVTPKKPEPPKAPKPRRLTGSDRLQIIGLVKGATLALEENRLMSPAGDNAYDRFRKLAEIDPTDKRANAGFREIATRYVGMAERSIEKGDLDQARTYVERARTADPGYTGIKSVERRLGR